LTRGSQNGQFNKVKMETVIHKFNSVHLEEQPHPEGESSDSCDDALADELVDFTEELRAELTAKLKKLKRESKSHASIQARFSTLKARTQSKIDNIKGMMKELPFEERKVRTIDEFSRAYNNDTKRQNRKHC
jgi:molecular chaperone GrpE (heat shock protein)